jgi:UDP-N-acetylglucosamine--N-acetylmuramyl-(pentapeptide) pyrophosphoryl-undecaprenol N-acetylglucosamine transferase
VPFEDKDGIFRGKAVVTGNPVRPLKKQFHASPSLGKFTIGIFGGSQGARAVNQTIVQALPFLAKLQSRLHIIHQTGKADFEQIKKSYDENAPFYEVIPFIYDVEQFYNRCDLLICRSGAITLAEITALGKPAILVPLPTSTHNHQVQNALRLDTAGAARMILQNDLTVTRLMKEIDECLKYPALLESMSAASRAMGKPDATKNVVDLALSLVKQ